MTRTVTFPCKDCKHTLLAHFAGVCLHCQIRGLVCCPYSREDNMSRHSGPIQLCMPCGEAMLAIPPGCKNADIIKVALDKMCASCQNKVQFAHIKVTHEMRKERARAQSPDLSSLQPDSSGWANVKKRR